MALSEPIEKAARVTAYEALISIEGRLRSLAADAKRIGADLTADPAYNTEATAEEKDVISGILTMAECIEQSE